MAVRNQEGVLLVIRRKNGVTKQVLRTPLGHLPDNRQQTLADSSQGVLDLWRHDLVVGPLDETQGGQTMEFATEHARRDIRAAAGAA